MSRGVIKAQPTIVDGIKFDSKREAARYGELKLLVRAGEITGLKTHVEHKLELDGRPLLIRSDGYPNGRKAKYTSDFEYTEATGIEVIEDVKGWTTPMARYRMGVFEMLTGKRVTVVR